MILFLLVFIAREIGLRILLPLLATAIILKRLPVAVRERRIQGLTVGRYTLLRNVSVAGLFIFVAIAVAWHLTLASVPALTAGWYNP